MPIDPSIDPIHRTRTAPAQIYRILPYREAILEGVLSSDIIGFQTYDYARHFLSTVESLLDANCSPQVCVGTGRPAADSPAVLFVRGSAGSLTRELLFARPFLCPVRSFDLLDTPVW